MNNKHFILIHGAWHSSTCWYKLSPLLKAQGHHVHAPDLPGHGTDITPHSKLSLKKYSQSITALIADIAEPVTLLGHSMAGSIISQVAELIPDKIEQLIYLSAFLPQDGQSIFDLMAMNRVDNKPAEIEQALIMSPDKRTCHIESSAVTGLFYGQCTKADQAIALSQFSNQACLPLANKVSLSEDAFGRVRRCYICCENDKVIPLAQQQQMLLNQPCNKVLTLAADHSPFLSMPKALAEILKDI